MSVGLKVLALAVGLVAAGGARANEPSPAALSLAATLIADVGLKATADNEVPTLAAKIQRQLTAMHPEMRSTLDETIPEDFVNEFQNSDADVLSDVVHGLAARMTEQEMRNSVAFFESPSGKKYLAVQPALSRELAISAEAWRPKLANEMVSWLREEMLKRATSSRPCPRGGEVRKRNCLRERSCSASAAFRLAEIVKFAQSFDQEAPLLAFLPAEVNGRKYGEPQPPKEG